MQELKSSSPETNESQEPSPEPSSTSNKEFIPNSFGVRELEGTYEMIVNAKHAIRRNEHWTGGDVEAMAMLITMLSQMESQYRNQLERAKAMEKDALRRAKEEIKQAAGAVNGKTEG